MAARHCDTGDSKLSPTAPGERFYPSVFLSGERSYVPCHEPDTVDGESGETLRDYIGIAIRRKAVVLAVFAVIFSLVVGYTCTCTRYFTSVATVEFEEKKPKQEDSVLAKPEYRSVQGVSCNPIGDSEIPDSGRNLCHPDESSRIA